MNFSEIKDFCVNNLSDMERWPSYYERRYQEFLTLVDLLPQKKYAKILEIGCGIGYYSAFLAQIADEVIATDLEVTNPKTNSPGLQITRDFLSKLNISNVTVMHASAVDLPFNDNTFDLVFSSHVLEHVPDIKKALSEIYRVLKPGGINFCVVPTAADKVYAFFLFYIYLMQRTAVKIFSLLFKTNKKQLAGGQAVLSDSKTSVLKYFPFPPPHGVSTHYLSELKNWTLNKWKETITQKNKIKLLNQYGLQLNPLLPLLGITFPKTGVKLFSKTRGFEKRFSQMPLIKNLGISTLIITEK